MIKAEKMNKKLQVLLFLNCQSQLLILIINAKIECFEILEKVLILQKSGRSYLNFVLLTQLNASIHDTQ